MADKKSVGHAYNVDFLNVVFAASSLFLFLSVIWMVWDDFDRDWKKTQRSFSQLETQVTQLNLQQAGRERRQEQAGLADRGGSRRQEEGQRQPVEGRRAPGQAEGRQQRPVPRHHRLPDDEGDLRSGSLRLRGDPRQRPAQRQEAGDRHRRGQPAARARPRAREGRSQRRRRPEAARPVHRRGRHRAEVDRRDQRGAEPPAQAPRRDRAEHGQGLLPQRAAARLHGADPQGPADPPPQRGRRRQLHPRREDGSLPDLPSGDRQEGLREIPAAVHHPSRSGDLSRRQLGAPDRQDRLHGLPRRHGAVGQLP